MLILSPEEIRNAEADANKNGLSYETMMESAGMGCAEHIIKNYPHSRNTVILCGKGKNGGDGFVIARALSDAGKCVSVILAFNSPSDELSEKNKARIDGVVSIYDGSTVTKKISSLIENADIIVDAVFGIGFKGELPDNVKGLFELTNASAAAKIAVDIPSGLSCDGENTEQCFRADETLSMLCFKKEHIYKPFSDICGKVSVIPIGFNCEQTKGVNAATLEEIKALLPCRPYNANKGTFGKALIAAGSYKMPGAAVIAAKGALTSGAGLTCLAFPDSIYASVTSKLSECVFIPLPSDKIGEMSETVTEAFSTGYNTYSAVAIGPGLSVSDGAKALLLSLLSNFEGKLIIDADGINILSRNINVLKDSNPDILITPHPGEFSRLTGLSVSEINTNRTEHAAGFAREHGVTILLKGENTVIAAPDGRVHINPTGCSALARGGSGDLLTGITVSLAAQGLDLYDAAVAGAYIHGLAGEIAQNKYTSYCATVERIYKCIPEALSQIIEGK